MSRIVPKLNLNKTPQLVENNSLVMAKNIRLLEDGTIGPDTSLEDIETHSGDATTTIVHHDEITDTVTTFKYTILDVETSIDYIINHDSPDEQSLNTVAFDFGNYTPERSGDPTSKKIVERISDNTCTLYCYIYSNGQITWTEELFTYNINRNFLLNSNGYVLALAIRDDIYNDTTNIDTDYPEYFYLVTPHNTIGGTISLYESNSSNVVSQEQDTRSSNSSEEEPSEESDAVLYHIINPVYQTTETQTVIISPAYDETVTTYDTINYIGQIVGVNNKIYFFKENNNIQYNNSIVASILARYPNEVFVGTTPSAGQKVTLDVDSYNYVTRNGIRLEDSYLANIQTPSSNARVKIYEYDEIEKTFTLVNCSWKYNGGKINGCVTINNTGDPILTICEYDVPSGIKVPIKHINVANCSTYDDESIYTQAPDIPITNLSLVEYYPQVIPAGVYQFFIRYEIKEHFYTNWFPCSFDSFTANKKTIDTVQGSITYVDLHEDSDQSFRFDVSHINTRAKKNYKRFQIGFILSHDNAVVARSWKHWDINTSTIDFDYDKDAIEEINIDDLLRVTYDLYNVENIASYKNKLYVSNYEETNFNDNDNDLKSYSQDIDIILKVEHLKNTSDKYLNGYILNESGGYYVSCYNTNVTHYFSELYGDFAWCHMGTMVNSTVAEETHYTNPNITGWNNIQWANKRWWVVKLYVKDTNNNEIILPYGTCTNDYSNYLSTQYTPSEAFNYIDENLGIPNEKLTDYILNVVRPYIKGINATDNEYYIEITNNGITSIIKARYIYFKIAIMRFDHYEDVAGVQHFWHVYKRYIYDCTFFARNKHNVEIKYSNVTEEAQTLLPFTDYDFYCHFVKSNGVITNGYYIDSLKIQQWGEVDTDKLGNTWDLIGEVPNHEALISNISSIAVPVYPHGTTTNPSTQTLNIKEITSDAIVYPTFKSNSNISLNSKGYVGYFISMVKHKNNVCELFNATLVHDSTNEYWFDCIELDTMLVKQYKNLKIVDWTGTSIDVTGDYAPSGYSENNNLDKFAEPGTVYAKPLNIIQTTSRYWIIPSDYVQDNNELLVKATPIIELSTNFDNYRNIFLQGYYCLVKKLLHNLGGTIYYINGTDIYNIGVSNGLTLTPIESEVNLAYSVAVNLHSNYNLNYLSLSQDINNQIRSYTITTESDPPVTTRHNQMLYTVDTLISSFITTLETTFKEYTRKYFYPKKESEILFNNVVRASNIDTDETHRYIYTFEAEDYYNVPTNRGIITNLIGIANTLYVHCEHSLFKFSDNKSLNAQEENVSLKEGDIFDSGISEVFDAQYGFAGLKHREQSLITYNAYIFYDEVAKTIYAFGGEQQIGSISDSIKKLILNINPTDVRFVGDELHNRFFVNFKNDNGNVCLSFNFNAKAFVSVHDIDFAFGFHSRNNVYFIHSVKYNNSVVGWSMYKMVDNIITLIEDRTTQYKTNYAAYQSCYVPSLINIKDCDSDISLNEVKAVNSCVDVIVNAPYEIIKQLDYISWICSEILDYGKTNNFVAEESLNDKYPGHKIRIYTDKTNTALFDLLDANGNAKISNEQRNINVSGDITPNPNSWQYIRYNCGVWSMNYFRDVRNIEDIFSYKDNANQITGGTGHSETTNLTPKKQRESLTQENSLIYGKYFVIRFIFNNRNFKLENVIVKMNDYGKTK